MSILDSKIIREQAAEIERLRTERDDLARLLRRLIHATLEFPVTQNMPGMDRPHPTKTIGDIRVAAENYMKLHSETYQ